MSSERRALALALVTTVASPARAEEDAPAAAAALLPDTAVATALTADAGPLPIEFHGYANQAWVKSDHNRYYTAESRDGTFHLVEAALIGAAQVTERTRIVLQVAGIINDVAPRPSLNLDFAFVDHSFADVFGVRVGRFRNLTNLYSEVWDTDIARLPIFLPTSVYDPQGRQLFMNMQGLQVYGTVRSRAVGSLDYAASVGALSPFSFQGVEDDVDFTAAGRVIYNTPYEGLRIGGSFAFAQSAITTRLGTAETTQLIAAGLVPATFDGAIESSIDSLWRFAGFAELNLERWTLAAEYAHMRYDVFADDPALAGIAPPLIARPDGLYVLTAYRFNDYFAAGAYASAYFTDARARTSKSPAAHSFDYAGTFRFDVNAYLSLKAEVHRIYGTALLDPVVNPGGPDANAGWLFAVRASAAF